MDREEFLKLASDHFGDKVRCEQIRDISEEDAKKIEINQEELLAYPAQAWLVYRDQKTNVLLCPNCDTQLMGFFGSFTWEITHGYGYCSNCKKVGFKLYHYIGKPEKRFELLAVTSF